MKKPAPSIPRSVAFSGVIGCLVMSLCGCVGPAVVVDVPSAASQATGIANAIRFEENAAPIDEPGGSAAQLGLVEATRRSLAFDPEVQIALARVRAAEAEAEQARLLPNPILSITVRPRFGPESAIITPALSEDLISILQRPRRASAADRRLRAAASEALVTTLNTLSQVQERYADVQAGEAQLVVLGARRKLLERLRDLASARLKAGEGSSLDLTTVDAQRENLQSEIAQKRIEVNEFRLDLARLIGQPGGRTDWQLSGWTSPPQIITTQEAWLASALRNRPEIQSSLWELAALGDDVILARFAPWEGTAVGVEAERDVQWSVGPSFSAPLPMFDMGQARARKAMAAVIEGRHKLTQARRQVVEDVRKAFDTFNGTQAVLREARLKLLPLQESRQRQAEAAYRAGESDLTTLLVAEEELQDTRAKLVEFEQKTTVAFIRLQRAVGGPGVAAELTPSTAPTTTSPTTRAVDVGRPTDAPAGSRLAPSDRLRTERLSQ